MFGRLGIAHQPSLAYRRRSELSVGRCLWALVGNTAHLCSGGNGRRNWANLGGENSESAGLKLSGIDKKTAKVSGNSQLRSERLLVLSPSRLPFRHPK
jgi:hypothetical protein